MASKDAPAPDIMNVKEIIEFAFGDFKKNTVNFKLVQTVLFLIARQLRLLERRVIVEVGPLTILPSDTTLTVTEVKIHATQKTKTKDREKGGMGGEKPGVAKQGTGAAAKGKKTGRGTQSSSSDKTSTDKTASSNEKTSTDRTTSTDKGSSPKRTTDKSPRTKTTSTDESQSAKTTATDKSQGAKTTATDKSQSAKTTATDKSQSAKTTSTGKSQSVKTTSTDQSQSAKTTSTDKSFSAKTTSTDKSSSPKTTSTDNSSTLKTTSTSTDKPSSKSKSSDRTFTRRTTSSSKEAAGRQKPDSYPDILDTLEEQKERELRIIHQRTDSFEETTKTPTPMASVSSMQYEKLLVVKKVPSSEARLGERVHGHRRTPQISVVTQEQFEQVADAVRQLEKKLLPVGTPGFLENAELMEELRKGASLTDAMAALQLSARLEATEKTLACLISMITKLALQTPGVELDSETRALVGISATWEKDAGSSEVSEEFEGKFSDGDLSAKVSKGSKRMTAPSTEAAFAVSGVAETDSTEATFAMSGAAETGMTEAGASTGAAQEPAETVSDLNRFVTFSDLQKASRQMYDEMIKKVKAITVRTSATAENAYKLSMKLEARLEASVLDSSRMVDLEKKVRQYAEQINSLDTGLSSQMTNYQEQLTQMQHDLEIGLDTMAEVLVNSGGDTEAVAELHSHFTNLQVDFEMISFRQKELKGAQDSIAYDLEHLWREIEMLRDTKSDREEVADALRDKAGICELNGLVSLQQFEAVRGDFLKRIRAAYDKFNNQENIWQKAIDDMVKVLNEKADLIQVHSLKDEIHKYIKRIKDRMQIISDVVGEPKSAIVSKRVFRDTACLSCGSPAHMDVEEPAKVPALPKFPSTRQPAEGAEAESQTKGGGDYGICYPNLPISHPRDPRAHICKRYCGGSHTMVTEGLNRALPGLVVQQAKRTINAAPGTDGKLYLMDEQSKKIPCLACNMPQPSPIASEPEPQIQAPIDSIDEFGNISLTPPAIDLSYN